MSKPIEFKAGTLAAMTAIVRELDNVRLADSMHTMLGGKGEFFADEMTIIDLSQLKEIPPQVDWAGFASLLRRYGLQPVALKNLPETLQESARKAGFAILANGVHETAREYPTSAQIANEKTVHQSASVLTVDTQAMIVDRFVRSGQQIYAKNRDLIVLCGVSHGAEIIADGNIHCYGPLRGRVLVGAQGNTNARLFCTNFGPELVSIAGVYRTFEKGIAENVAGKPAYAMLRPSGTQSDESSHTLSIEPLQLD